jgi:hypothetical protein
MRGLTRLISAEEKKRIKPKKTPPGARASALLAPPRAALRASAPARQDAAGD